MIRAKSFDASASGTVALGQLIGFSFRNLSPNQKATVRLRRGTATGQLIASIEFCPEESVQMDYTIPRDLSVDGTQFPLYVEIVSGTLEGSVHGY